MKVSRENEALIKQEYLKEILEYEQETGIFTWVKLAKNVHNIHIGDIAGCLDKRNGYISIRINNKKYRAHRLAWLYVIGNWPEFEIDHINHIRNDNRFENLRDTDKNRWNKSEQKNNTSGYVGVVLDKPTKKWQAQIQVNGKCIYLGLFTDIEEASQAYQEAKEKYHIIGE